MTTAAGRALADDTSTKTIPAKPDKTYSGIVTAINPTERVLEVKGLLLTKKFNLGSSCTYALLNEPDATLNDLHPGQKVIVGYQNPSGVFVADRVQQEPMSYVGTVKTIDPATRTMTVHVSLGDRTFQIADDCKVMLRNNRSGTFADVQPGNHVTVIYETPNSKLTARQIAQTSVSFTGELTAIDLSDRTAKAKSLFGTKRFHIATGCAVVLNGKTGAQLNDLKLGDNLAFSYDEVNGVNIVNRIGTTEKQQETTVAQPMEP